MIGAGEREGRGDETNPYLSEEGDGALLSVGNEKSEAADAPPAHTGQSFPSESIKSS